MCRCLLPASAIVLCCAFSSVAQTQSWRSTGEEAHLINRLELLNGAFLDATHTGHVQLAAKPCTDFLLRTSTTSRADSFNKIQALAQLGDWQNSDNMATDDVKKRWLYKGAHMYFGQKHNDFSLVVNPIINYQHGGENNQSSGPLFINARGFDIRANIKQRLYFYTQLTDNQERGPGYAQKFMSDMFQVPGATYNKPFNQKPSYAGGWDYSIAKGYIGYTVLPGHLDLNFGHDKFFIGNGYRSLFLSDFGANMLFAKMDLKFWKLHYQTIFSELMPTLQFSGNANYARKYAALHHASFHFKPWLQVGVFEGVMQGRKDHFEFQYLNPLIFYRTIEQSIGSPDNAVVGLDLRVLPLARTELYGQLLLDEFVRDALLAKTKDWRNKYAWQLGIKHMNLAGIKNLDVQLEYNYIRPFTYTYADSVRDYSHYNQPLAHPNGANLTEFVAVIRYQPLPRLAIRADYIRRAQGMDTSATKSNGGNIFKSYNARVDDTGFIMGNGLLKITNYLNVNAAYQLYNQLYIDAGFTMNTQLSVQEHLTSNLAYLGLRLNAARRLYQY
jgi:hypothetical protein